MNPLQDINTPMVKDSRQTIPFHRAATALPAILDTKATIITPIVYAQVIPSSNNPIFVRKPDNAKYYGQRDLSAVYEREK